MRASPYTSKAAWDALLSDMENAVRKFSKSKSKSDVSNIPPAIVPGSNDIFIALGRAAEGSGAYENAWKYYMTANDYEKRKHKSYNAMKTQEAEMSAITYFDKDFFEDEWPTLLWWCVDQ